VPLENRHLKALGIRVAHKWRPAHVLPDDGDGTATFGIFVQKIHPNGILKTKNTAVDDQYEVAHFSPTDKYCAVSELNYHRSEQIFASPSPYIICMAPPSKKLNWRQVRPYLIDPKKFPILCIYKTWHHAPITMVAGSDIETSQAKSHECTNCDHPWPFRFMIPQEWQHLV